MSGKTNLGSKSVCKMLLATDKIKIANIQQVSFQDCKILE